jgi:hypothetical protein
MPTFSHGRLAVFKVADSGAVMRDISNVVKSGALTRTAETAEVSALGAASKSYIPGLKDGKISVDGMADVTVSGYLDGILGSATTFEYYPSGTATSNVKYSGACILTSLATSADIGGAVSLKGEFQITGDVTRAIV